MKLTKKIYLILLTIIISIFIVFRVSFLETLPQGFYVDESSIAYNAYSILKTGTDEHNFSFPLYFKAFGDYKNPIFIYSQVALFALLEPTKLAAKLTSALWGLGTILVFYFFIKSRNKSTQLILPATLLLLTSPWHIQLSRTVFEIISYPFFLFVSIYLVWKIELLNIKLFNLDIHLTNPTRGKYSLKTKMLKCIPQLFNKKIYKKNKLSTFFKKANLTGLKKLILTSIFINKKNNTKWSFLKNTNTHNNHTLLYLLALTLGLSFYTYTAARIVSPLLFIGFLWIYRKNFNLKEIIKSIIVFSLCLLPAIIWEKYNPGVMMARYQIVGLSRYSLNTYEFINKFIAGYFSHFDPNFLFIHGDKNLRHSSDWHANFLWSTIPMIATGIYQIFTKKTKFLRWIFLGIIISPVPSALTIQTPHTLRSIGLMVFLIIVALIGLEKIFQYSKQKKLKIFYILTFLLIFESLFFLHNYFNSYATKAGAWYEADTYESIEKVFEQSGPYFFSNKLYPGTYTTVAFFQKNISNNFADLTNLKKSTVPSTIIKSTQTNFINFKKVNKTGTYLLTKNECYQLARQPDVFKNNNIKEIWVNNSSCVYQVVTLSELK